jgi:hypothetical protein
MRLHDAAIEDAEPLFHQRISFDAVDVEDRRVRGKTRSGRG